jgi:Xaa-Pro aminopeptidase
MSLPETTILVARQLQVRDRLASQNLDGLVVTAPANIRYLTNHAGSAGTLVVTRSQMHLLVDTRYEEAVRRVQNSPSACAGLEVWPVSDSYEEALVDALARLDGPVVVGIEAGHLVVGRYEWLNRTLDARRIPVSLRSTERVVEQSRVIKDPVEIATLREAAVRLEGVARAAFGAVRAGVSEMEVAGVIEAAIRAAGYEAPAFDTIVASGPNSALPHHRPGRRRLVDGDLVVLDFGGVLDGYCSDLTRTVSVGTPSPDAERLHAAVLDAQQAALDAIRPGVASSAVDDAARQALVARGLGEAFGHGTGHGLGLDIHEEPRVGRRRTGQAETLLQPGMVFTVEPGVYLPGLGGVRIEDDVLVTANGHERLTTVPRELVGLG